MSKELRYVMAHRLPTRTVVGIRVRRRLHALAAACEHCATTTVRTTPSAGLGSSVESRTRSHPVVLHDAGLPPKGTTGAGKQYDHALAAGPSTTTSWATSLRRRRALPPSTPRSPLALRQHVGIDLPRRTAVSVTKPPLHHGPENASVSTRCPHVVPGTLTRLTTSAHGLGSVDTGGKSLGRPACQEWSLSCRDTARHLSLLNTLRQRWVGFSGSKQGSHTQPRQV